MTYENIKYMALIEILIHLFVRHYNLLWTLAFDTILPNSQLSLAIACLMFISIIFNCFQLCPTIFYMVFPFSLFLPLQQLQFVFCILLFCIFSTWTHCLSRKDFINFKVSFPCNILFISLFISIIQHSPSLTGPYILMTTFQVFWAHLLLLGSSGFLSCKSVWVILGFVLKLTFWRRNYFFQF